MSDCFATIVPSDPGFVPTQESIATLVRLLHVLAPALGAIEPHLSRGIMLFDAGSNFESVTCPYCNRKLDLEWWGNTCGQDQHQGFFRLDSHTLPCCGRLGALNDLVYQWHKAFGQFGLEVINPGRPPFRTEEVEKVRLAMGSPVSIVYRHL
jgi:hypothetical protein